MNTITPGAKKATVIGAVIALLFSVLMLAAPAQAAVGVDLTTTTPSVTVGDTITLNWTSTEAVTLVAGGSWSGSKAAPSGTENITATTAGANTFTLLATDINGREATGTVTVNVAAAPANEVTPGPVTFPGECTVIVPNTAGVIYRVTIDGDTSEINPGTYDGFDFFGDNPAVFNAAADADHVIAPGATVTWTYDPFEDCLGDIGTDNLVTATTACSSVTFTSVADQPVDVLYGDANNANADGEFTLAPGASHTVHTSRAHLFFAAFSQDEQLAQLDEITVPQHCGVDVTDDDPDVKWPAKAKHPTHAPAAGVNAESGGPSIPALAILGALALTAVRRMYALRG